MERVRSYYNLICAGLIRRNGARVHCRKRIVHRAFKDAYGTFNFIPQDLRIQPDRLGYYYCSCGAQHR